MASDAPNSMAVKKWSDDRENGDEKPNDEQHEKDALDQCDPFCIVAHLRPICISSAFSLLRSNQAGLLPGSTK